MCFPIWQSANNDAEKFKMNELPALQPWHLLARESAHKDSRTASYLVLPSKRAPRWVLPLENSAVARHGLDLYAPSSTIGKIYRRLLQFATRFAPLLGSRRVNLDMRHPTALALYINEFSQGAPIYIAISCGTNWARRKTTFQLMNAQGVAKAYLKVANVRLARVALKREAEMLELLAQTGSVHVCSVPQLIAFGEKDQNLVLTQRAGPRFSSGNIFSNAHWTFLCTLVNNGVQNYPNDFIRSRNLIERATAVAQSVNQNDAVIIKESLQFLLSIAPKQIKTCLEHGDFAPWNIRHQNKLKTSPIFVFDWEQGCESGVPVFDVLHFIIQVECLVHKNKEARIYESLNALKRNGQFQSYLLHAAIDEETLIAIKIGYLLHAIIDAVEIGDAPALSSHQRIRLALLNMLLKNSI
jgi:hypothetical protein